jgi:hypothetical protein
MEKDIELFIVKGLFENVSYFRNVAANLDPNFFEEDSAPIVKFLKNYFAKYEQIPDYSVALNAICSSKKYEDSVKKDVEDSLRRAKNNDFDVKKNGEWLFDETKKFANKRAIFKVFQEGAVELNKDGDEADYGKLESSMREALSMDWNEDMGIDFFDVDGIDDIYDSLSDVSIRIPIGVNVIDEAINGGIPGQTKFCGVLVGGAGMGKCVSFINTIKVRNKTTGEVIKLPIGEFHEIVKGQRNGNEKGKSS